MNVVCSRWRQQLNKNGHQPPGTEEVLWEFDGVFQRPRGVPPERMHDHTIALKESNLIPNLRPYRYPVERLVEDMLKSGVIRPSTSPFSSPIILVKKDVSREFGVDYRAMNRITAVIYFKVGPKLCLPSNQNERGGYS